jgi:hypothetical protein
MLFTDALAYVLAGTPLPKCGPCLYLSLHSGKAEPKSQNDNEISYAGYGRVQVARKLESWMVDDSGVSNRVAIKFPAVKAATRDVVSCVVIGHAAEGAGDVLWAWWLDKPLSLVKGTIPVLEPGEIASEFQFDYSED